VSRIDNTNICSCGRAFPTKPIDKRGKLARARAFPTKPVDKVRKALSHKIGGEGERGRLLMKNARPRGEGKGTAAYGKNAATSGFSLFTGGSVSDETGQKEKSMYSL
jgi:hypothetical protein